MSSSIPRQALEETNRAYEERIKNLEKVLQTSYTKMASSTLESAEINSLRRQIADLQKVKADERIDIEEAKSKIIELESILRNKNTELDILKHHSTELEESLEQLNNSCKDQTVQIQNTTLSQLYVQLQSFNDRGSSPKPGFTLENFQREMIQCLDKFRKQSEDAESCLKDDNSKKEDDALMNQIEDLTSRLQFATNQIQNLQRDLNMLLEEKRIFQMELETKTLNMESILQKLDKKISFQSFTLGNLVLFLPTRSPIAWAAFNSNSPHYFLSLEEHANFPDQIR